MLVIMGEFLQDLPDEFQKEYMERETEILDETFEALEKFSKEIIE